MPMSEEEKPASVWSQWFNVDDPWTDEFSPYQGPGDYETIDNIESRYGTICDSEYEIGWAECRLSLGNDDDTFSSGSLIDTGDVLHEPCTSTVGLVCRDEDQLDGHMCQDYSIRFKCEYTGGEDGYENMFPEFDARIYLILAIVPILIFLIRLVWIFVCRRRRRQQRRQRRRLQRGLQALSGNGDGDDDDDDDDDESINSDLARPPPSYQDLFSSGTPPSVFVITREGTAACPKCKDANCSAINDTTTTQRGSRVSTQNSSSTPAPATPVTDVVDSSAPNTPTDQSPTSGENTESCNTTSTPGDSSASVNENTPAGQPQDEGGERISSPDENTTTATTTSNSNSNNDSSSSSTIVPLSVSQLSTATGDAGSNNNTSDIPADVPAPCACACHKSRPPTGRGVSYYDNAAFSPDTSNPTPSGVPVGLRGRHIPALPRPASGVSMVTLSELPCYEDALELEKKFAAEKHKE